MFYSLCQYYDQYEKGRDSHLNVGVVWSNCTSRKCLLWSFAATYSELAVCLARLGSFCSIHLSFQIIWIIKVVYPKHKWAPFNYNVAALYPWNLSKCTGSIRCLLCWWEVDGIFNSMFLLHRGNEKEWTVRILESVTGCSSSPKVIMCDS